LVISAASAFKISRGKKQTDGGRNTTPTTAVGVGNKFYYSEGQVI